MELDFIDTSLHCQATRYSHYEKLDGVERCIDDELPFEIPESWCWCRLKSIVNVVSARRVHQSDWRSEGVPFYRAREIGKLADTGFVDNELYISEALYTKLSSSGVPHGGDLMVTAVGTLGKTYIVKGDDRFYYKDASVICFENFSKVVPAYLKIQMCGNSIQLLHTCVGIQQRYHHRHHFSRVILPDKKTRRLHHRNRMFA